MTDAVKNGELRDPRLSRSVVMGNSSAPQSHQMPDGRQTPRPSFDETSGKHVASPSSSKRPGVSSPMMASSPQSSQSSSGGSPKKRKKTKFPPQSNTLLNYFGTPPSKKSLIDESAERSSESSSHKHAQKSSRHSSNESPSRHSHESSAEHHKHSTPRSPDADQSKSWGSSCRSPPPHYPAGQPRPSFWEQHERSPGPLSWKRRHRSSEDKHPSSSDISEVHVSHSQPSSSRNKEVLRSRNVSGSSSSGAGSDKKFPIIRPLIQRGPSYDEILRMAEENVDKQKSDRRIDHHRIGLGSPGKLVHLQETENESTSCSDDESVPSKAQIKHRHSSGELHRVGSGKFSLMKSRHLSGPDKESHGRTMSNKHNHHLDIDKNKFYRDIMKRSPVVRIIRINTPSPVKITDELLKRCGSPGVLSDGGISNYNGNKKDDLKRHHSADDMDSDNSMINYSVYKSTPKRQRTPSELEEKTSSLHKADLSSAEMEHARTNNDPESNESNEPKEAPSDKDVAGPSQQGVAITGVRHLFRELSTPSVGSCSDNAESGTEETKTTSPKSKLKLGSLHLDLNKLKTKIQLTTPNKRKSSTEEPMDIGTDSDSVGSGSSRSTPGIESPDLSSTSTECAQNNMDVDGGDVTPSVVSDVDTKTVNDENSSMEDLMSGNDEKESQKTSLANTTQGIEENELASSPMEDQPSPDDPQQSASTNLVKPRSLETLLACVDKSDEDLLASDDESDDDFLMAKPSALEEIVQLSTLPLPQTPEKPLSLSQMSNDSLQSPCHSSSAYTRAPTDKNKKLKFTLDSMMDIKAQNGHDEGADMTRYLKNNMQEPGKQVDVSEETSGIQANMKAKCDKYKIDNEQIPALHPGDDVFDSHKMGELFCFPHTLSLQDCGFNPIKANAMEKLLLDATPDDLIELINAQCLREVYAAKPCPDSIMLWLFQLMSIHPSVYVTQNCFQTLWYLLTSCLSIHPNADPWVPALRDVARVFFNYGSDFQTLLPSVVRPGFGFEDARSVRGKENDGNDDERRPGKIKCHDNYGLVGLPTVNVMEVIKIFTQVLITHGLKGRGTCYTPDELECLLFLVTKTALDKQLIGLAVQVDFQLCISAILECFDDNIWDKQVSELCNALSQISEHHHNLVYVVQLMPTNSQRGRLMRRRLSYAMLKKILSSMSIPASSMSNMIQFGENGKGNGFTCSETVKVSDLLPILQACKPDAQTDYYQLNSVITLIDLGVGNEPLKSLEKIDLERLILKLRELTGDIKDGFRHLNRVQVKDLMLRTVNKMTVLSQSMMSKQKSLYAYVKSIDEDAEEHLVESKDEAEMDSSDEEDREEGRVQEDPGDAWHQDEEVHLID